MESRKFIFQRLSVLLNIGILEFANKKIENFNDVFVDNPLVCSNELRTKLMSMTEKQNGPVFYPDQFHVCWGCEKDGNRYFFWGPMAEVTLDFLEEHQYNIFYKLPREGNVRLQKYSPSEMLQITEVISYAISKKEYFDEELINNNGLSFLNEVKKEDIRNEQDDDTIYHHTYREERVLLDWVKKGEVEEAVKYTKNMDMNLGRLSVQEKNHWHNAAVVGITLCTRAAIEGGISPASAYKLSDYYIQKADESKNITEMLDWRNKAIMDLTRRVRENNNKKIYSSYVEQCRDYIAKNYRSKIYLSSIAERLGISKSYLSRLFFKEMGEHIQDTIIKYRVNKAADLLMYSNESIANIGDYVNFPNQSYFGRVFKKHKGMTPKDFRNHYKPKEFS